MDYTSPRFDSLDAATGNKFPNVFTSFHEFKSHAQGILSATFTGPQDYLSFRGRLFYNSPENRNLLNALEDVSSTNYRTITLDPYFTYPPPQDRNHEAYIITLSTFTDLNTFRTKYNRAIRKIHENYRQNINKLRAATTIQEVENIVVAAFAPPYNVPGYPQDSWPEFVHSTYIQVWGGEYYYYPIDNL